MTGEHDGVSLLIGFSNVKTWETFLSIKFKFKKLTAAEPNRNTPLMSHTKKKKKTKYIYIYESKQRNIQL